MAEPDDPAPNSIAGVAPPEPPFADVGNQLGIGPNFYPGATNWRFERGAINGGQVVFAIFETLVGRFVVTFSPESARAFADQLRNAGGGIIVADEMPPAGRHLTPVD